MIAERTARSLVNKCKKKKNCKCKLIINTKVSVEIYFPNNDVMVKNPEMTYGYTASQPPFS